MQRLTWLLFVATLIILSSCAATPSSEASKTTLGFEEDEQDRFPVSWSGGPRETMHVDASTAASGSKSIRLDRQSIGARGFSAISKRLKIDFAGRWIELRGSLRTEDANGFAGLWLREDGVFGTLRIDNMAERKIGGTTPWTQYNIRLPLDPDANALVFGALLDGSGTAWVDDLEILVDDRPLAQAPRRIIPTTGVETDHAFDAGSGIALTSLSDQQIENLTALGLVWGLLKYHHPAVATGKYHWDYELFRILPGVLAAPDAAHRNVVLSTWISALGVLENCDPCAVAPAEPQQLPPTDWIHSTNLWGEELSKTLERIYVRRFAGAEQFYVSQDRYIGNPVFHELAYPAMQFPDAGLRILALFRLWNIVEYWSPYRNLIDGDWQTVLKEFLPKVVEANSREEYERLLLAVLAKIGDGHANIWRDLAAIQPPQGSCHWPVELRVAEGRPVVSGVTGKDAALQIGDVVTAVEGRAVHELFKAWAPYYSASTDARRLRDMAGSLGRGQCGDSIVTIRRRGHSHSITLKRTSDPYRAPWDDRPGDTFQLLSPQIAYLKLSSIRVADIDNYLERAAGTRGLVIDLRNYPSEFVVFALGSRLVHQQTPFARFTGGTMQTPGAFGWGEPVHLEPHGGAYRGEIAFW